MRWPTHKVRIAKCAARIAYRSRADRARIACCEHGHGNGMACACNVQIVHNGRSSDEYLVVQCAL
eukprot:9006727-Lingulodinium_polyedra.AAC.1